MIASYLRRGSEYFLALRRIDDRIFYVENMRYDKSINE